ncbi:hypothetical protein OG568_45175 [Streptomyces sp. NBC_01450]|uniref:hypothetical protein n=1 Tax=Streptomyces sp. NBC_01450 TaxID=2903871 RepID=UPI002E377553|nr:hypothetical protein [Streptomyces sp. NBC_01450]
MAPVTDTTFPLGAIAEAHRYLEAGGRRRRARERGPLHRASGSRSWGRTAPR